MTETPPPIGWRRLLAPRLRRVDLAVAALLAVLGFAAVVQVRATQEEGPLAAARQEADKYNFHVHYALKANANLPVLEAMRLEGVEPRK